MAQFVVPAITQVGAKSRIKAVGGDGTPFALQFIRDKNVVAANVALGPLRVAYANMDQALRYLLGLDPLRQGNPQEPRLFDSTNIADTGTPPTDTKGFGDDYVSGYERIWGLRK
jgi:ribose transport system substrate-binding protein